MSLAFKLFSLGVVNKSPPPATKGVKASLYCATHPKECASRAMNRTKEAKRRRDEFYTAEDGSHVAFGDAPRNMQTVSSRVVGKCKKSVVLRIGQKVETSTTGDTKACDDVQSKENRAMVASKEAIPRLQKKYSPKNMLQSFWNTQKGAARELTNGKNYKDSVDYVSVVCGLIWALLSMTFVFYQLEGAT